MNTSKPLPNADTSSKDKPVPKEPLGTLMMKILLKRPTYCLVVIALVLASFRGYFFMVNYVPPDTGIVYSKVKMQSVLTREPGDASMLYIGPTQKPVPRDSEVLIKVKAFGISRLDIMQRQGSWSPDKSRSQVMGNEVAGVVTEVGKNVRKFKPGDKVCGLSLGGGYSEFAVINDSLTIPLPTVMNFEQGAAFPEAYFAAYNALYMVGSLNPGDDILIHGGAGSIASALIQMGKAGLANKIYITAKSYEKIKHGERLGASKGINTETDAFDEKVLKANYNQGVNMILDLSTQDMDKNLNSLAPNGHLVLMGLESAEFSRMSRLDLIVSKGLKVEGANLYTLDKVKLKKIANKLQSEIIPLIIKKTIKVTVDKTFNWVEIADAHRYLESQNNKGKVIATIE